MSARVLGGVLIAVWVGGGALAKGPAAEPIRSVAVGPHAELMVNGRPFLPLMLWLQSEARIADGLAIGANTFTGNGGKLGSKQYLDALAEHGLYGVLPFDPSVVGHSHLLGWIHGDEPDLPRRVTDARIAPGHGLRINGKAPLERLVDGVTHSWSVLDPLEGAELTIRLAKPATVRRLGIWLTISPGLAVAKEVSFRSGGAEIGRAMLPRRKGEQRVELERPARIESLTVRVLTVYPGRHEWGSIGELAAYDSRGTNVLLCPSRVVPRSAPDQVAAAWRRIKQADRSRPVFLNLTAYFMKEFDRYDAATKAKLYPEYVKCCDVIGFDVYPIFGWAKPEWLYRVAEGVSELKGLAGPQRPVFAWIETNKGSRWVRPDRQLPVRPQETRAEVWMALIRGATAIGYFTHSWVPRYRQFAAEPDMVAELRRLNGQLTRLAPAILAPSAKTKVSMTIDGPLTCHWKATQLDGVLYIFAQNIDMSRRAGQATIRVAGLKAGATVEVVDEQRSITAAADGEFNDQFAPLAEHIYRIESESP